MKGKYFKHSVYFLFCSYIFACNNNKLKNTVSDSPKNGTINISVDESFRPVIEEEIKMYEGSNPDAHIIAHYKPEAECFKDFYLDTSNRMIIVTRGLTRKESKFYTDSLNYTPVSNRIAWDAIAIVVNKMSNDTLFTIQSLQQLLQGKLGDKTKIVFDGISATSSFRFVTDSILHGTALDTSIVKAVKTSKDVLNYIAQHNDAIGFVGASWVANPEDIEQTNMLKKIKIAYVKCNLCKDTPYVKPTQQSILTKRYSLVRGLYYIVKENYSGLGSGFADFLNYERGQLIFRRSYLGPIMDFDIRSVRINEKL